MASKTRESTYEKQYRLYLESYDKYSKKAEMEGKGIPYSYKRFKMQFDDAIAIFEEEGRTYNKYDLGRVLAKSQQLYSDKQLRAFREAMNEQYKEIRKRAAKGERLDEGEQAILNYMAQENLTMLNADFAYKNMRELQVIFDASWGFRSYIQS